MRGFLDAKAMAKTLRHELKTRNIDLGHSECLEVTARQFGFRDWNTMAAELPATACLKASPHNPIQPIPSGWILSGTRIDLYSAGSLPSPDRMDETALFIASRSQVSSHEHEQTPDGAFATIMQTCLADEYRGKRVAFTADLKCEDILGSATIWMRVDDSNGLHIAFDNLEKPMTNGALKTRSDWTRREVVLDIPDKGATINFGFYLFGAGRAWASRLAFSPTESLPTPIRRQAGLITAPRNLDLRAA